MKSLFYSAVVAVAMCFFVSCGNSGSTATTDRDSTCVDSVVVVDSLDSTFVDSVDVDSVCLD